MRENKNYWHVYYDSQTIDRCERIRQEYCIETSGVFLHVDAYLQVEADAPVLLMTHGEGGYSRLFVRVALALFELGYSVLVVDQRGHGYSSGRQADFTLNHLIEDVLDAVHWARRNFSGPLIVAGTNQGGGLVYQAAGMGAPLLGIICHQLYDFSNQNDAFAGSRFSSLLEIPGGVSFAGSIARAMMAISPRMRLRYNSITRFEGLLDERDNGNFEAWLEDPNPARIVSLGYAVSTFTTNPTVPFEENGLPILVINPMRDRMVNPQITRRNFAKLRGPKTYEEIDFGHWSLTEEFAHIWANSADRWIKGVLRPFRTGEGIYLTPRG
jgi:alpha-beta hydrolase superfamily lysophospholipase